MEDVTIVYVRGQIFSFSLTRTFLDESPDWRRFVSPGQQWFKHALTLTMQEAVRRYMTSLQLDYGRLDFLLDREGLYWFCEVNPNGQFAWLDLADEHGLLSAIVDEVSPATDVRPLSYRHPLDRSDDTGAPTSAVSSFGSDSSLHGAAAHVSGLPELSTSAPLHAEVGTR